MYYSWGGLKPDQQSADDTSLCFASAPLDQPMEILGGCQVKLLATASAAPVAHWIVRLSDASPDGAVTLVTGKALNGAHRGTVGARTVINSETQPAALVHVPGEEYTFDLLLRDTSWVFPKSHQIRVAVSHAQWPMFFPTPHAFRSSLRVAVGAIDAGAARVSHIVLPVVSSTPGAASLAVPSIGRIVPKETRPLTALSSTASGVTKQLERITGTAKI